MVSRDGLFFRPIRFLPGRTETVRSGSSVSFSDDLLENKPLKLAKVDATEAAELAQKYDVTGYPTIKMFRKGSVFDYNGGRERHSIVSYLTEQAGPPSTEITTKKAFDNILKKA